MAVATIFYIKSVASPLLFLLSGGLSSWLGSGCRLFLLREVVELLHQLIACKHCLLKVVAELYGMRCTRRYAQLAECATAKVVHIFNQFLAFFAVKQIQHIRQDVDSTVEAVNLT